MSRHATPCRVGSVEVITRPFAVERKATLRFSYHTPTGLLREMKIAVDVRDIICIGRTIASLKADYKKLAQDLANAL